jgi:hypothetical protein
MKENNLTLSKKQWIAIRSLKIKNSPNSNKKWNWNALA